MDSNTLKKFLYDINDTIRAYSYDKTIIELFEDMVDIYPQQIAIRLNNKNVTYTEFNAHANQLAWYLRKKGIVPNTIVGIEMDRSYEMLIGIFAILKAGGAYLPLDPLCPIVRKKQIINDSKMSFLIINHPEEVLESDCCVLNLAQLEISTANHRNPPKVNTPTDLVYVIYTSGSTGVPKGVLIEHHALMNRLEWMQEKFPLNLNDVLIQKTPFTFDVSVWEIFWWAITGASLTLLAAKKEHDVRLLTQLIEKYKITTLHFVPSVLRIFLNYIEVGFDLKKLTSLRYIFSSGEELDSHTVQRFKKIFNNSFPILINLYGPTEATIDVSYYICNKNSYTQQIPIGRPINNITLYVLNEKLEHSPINVPGELHISGVGLAKGYLNQPELTQKVFINNPHLPRELMYKTGDLVKWNTEGELIFLGRLDDQIKLRGLRIELTEIQHHLREHSKVQDAFVMCITESNFEQNLVAFVIAKDTYEDLTLELSRFLGNTLPNYMIPSIFIFLESLPLKNNGKIDRTKLIERFQEESRIDA